jgi:hypothetical protein
MSSYAHTHTRTHTHTHTHTQVDDVAAKTDATNSEAKVPRVPNRVTFSVCNNMAKPAPADTLSSLVMGLAVLKPDAN